MIYTNTDGYGIRRKGTLRWTIDKPMKVKPVIVGEEIKNGETFLKDNQGKTYKKDRFEMMWGKVK